LEGVTKANKMAGIGPHKREMAEHSVSAENGIVSLFAARADVVKLLFP
jgi:hypothetical protein